MPKNPKKAAPAAAPDERVMESLIEALKASNQRNEQFEAACAAYSAGLVAADRDLRDCEAAREATQELLNACLSPDVDAKFTPAAVAVRTFMCSQIRRDGWLDPSEATALRNELTSTRLALELARAQATVKP